MGQQHLGGADAIAAKLAFVDLGETHLAHCRGGLQFMDFLGAPDPAQPLHAFGDGAGADQHDFLAGHAQLGDLCRPTGDGLVIEALAVVGHQAGPNLDDDTFCLGDDRLHGGNPVCWVLLFCFCS